MVDPGDSKREIVSMDAQPSPHPTLEALRAYCLGECDDSSTHIVREHLQDCPDCRRLMDEMLPDSFVGLLRDAPEASERLASRPASDSAPRTANAKG